MSFLTPGKIFIPMSTLAITAGVIIAVALVIWYMGKNKKAAPAAAPVAAAPAAAAETAAVEVPLGPVAPGSAGSLKLYDTPPKTAAMVMAIVADKLGKPLNELRFISIKEVK